LKVLIVEDEALLAMSYKMALEEGEFEVVGIASSADEAFRLSVTKKPEVVLMDITLKGELDGIDSAKFIRTNYNIPIIFITGNTDEMTKKRALEVKPRGYLEKPVDCEKLHQALCADNSLDV